MTLWDVASAAIDAAFAEPVTYDGASLPAPTVVHVIWSDAAGASFQGPGNTLRQVSCEIRQDDLPGRPSKADRLLRGGIIWKPKQVETRDDIGKWVVVLERAGAEA